MVLRSILKITLDHFERRSKYRYTVGFLAAIDVLLLSIWLRSGVPASHAQSKSSILFIPEDRLSLAQKSKIIYTEQRFAFPAKVGNFITSPNSVRLFGVLMMPEDPG